MTQPEKTDLRADLVALVDADDAQSHLVLGWRDNPPAYNLRLVDTEEELGEQFLQRAQVAAASLAGDRTRVDYDPDWPLGDHYYFELLSDEFPGDNLFADLSDFLNLPRFDRKQLRKPRIYIVAVQAEEGVAYFGRRMAYLTVLNRRGGRINAIWDGSTFNSLTNSVATFSETFDWIQYEDRLYVLDDKNFHAEFRDVEGLANAVQEHVDAIAQKIPIVGAAEFAARCRASVPMASKLQRVAENGIWTEDVKALKKYAKQWNIPVKWKGSSLVFDGSIEHQWAILKLLDEDGTEGPVSGRHYESASKRRVG